MVKFYYENQMFNNARLDGKMEKKLFRKTKCANDDNKLNLIIYNKGTKNKNHIIKNSLDNNSILKVPYKVYTINYLVEDC